MRGRAEKCWAEGREGLAWRRDSMTSMRGWRRRSSSDRGARGGGGMEVGDRGEGVGHHLGLERGEREHVRLDLEVCRLGAEPGGLCLLLAQADHEAGDVVAGAVAFDDVEELADLEGLAGERGGGLLEVAIELAELVVRVRVRLADGLGRGILVDDVLGELVEDEVLHGASRNVAVAAGLADRLQLREQRY
jgi:hypothetical protein